MAKNKIKGKNNSPARAPQSAPSLSPEFPLQVESLLRNAEANAHPEDLERLSEVSPADATNETLVRLVRDASKAKDLLEQQLERAKKETIEIEQWRSSLDQQRAELKQSKQELNDERARLSRQRQELEEKQRQLLTREEDLQARESNAEAGFLKQREASVQAFKAEVEALRAESRQYSESLAQEHVIWEETRHQQQIGLRFELEQMRRNAAAEIEREREAFMQQQEEERARLVQEQARLRELAWTVKQERQRLEGEEQNLREERELLQQKISQMIAKKEECLHAELDDAQTRLEEAREHRDELAVRLREREESDRRFGNQSPEQVLEQVNALQRENDGLRQQLANSLSASATQRLQDLETEKQQWEHERLQLLAEHSSMKQQLSRAQQSVIERESLRDEKTALESARRLQQEHLKALQEQIDQLAAQQQGKEPFPACTAMDCSRELSRPLPLDHARVNLTALVEDVRNRMAGTDKLFYSTRVVRSFLGGLAMSHLHLLQGISGTGKTSLPIAFAKAIGAASALVEVQSSWRDRQDILGHYNAFEKRFYETEFLKALYRAGTPRHADQSMLIVLDEANLSNMEYYFADLLSVLERRSGEQILTVHSAAVANPPQRFVDGCKLPLPPNVWFVATANHDETTKDFADKTYDRSHVMELPRHHDQFDPSPMAPPAPVSLQALSKAFEEARDRHKDEAARVRSLLNAGPVGAQLEKTFRIGWGNRLEHQINSYVPVVCAAGGSVGEAADHLLATKVLRKLRNRHLDDADKLKALRQEVELALLDLDGRWMDNVMKGKTVSSSLRLLEEEMDRWGVAVEEEVTR